MNRSGRSRRRQGGFVLVVVLLLTAAIISSAVSIYHVTEIEARASTRNVRATQAFSIAYAGLRRAIAAAKNDNGSLVPGLNTILTAAPTVTTVTMDGVRFQTYQAAGDCLTANQYPLGGGYFCLYMLDDPEERDGVSTAESNSTVLIRSYAKVSNAEAMVGRVVLKNIPQGAAIEAGGTFTMVNNTHVCGTGGISANTIALAMGDCACGSIAAATCASCATLGNCACSPCDAQSQSVGTPPTPPAITIPGITSWLDNEGIGAPGSTGNVLGTTGRCLFYFKENGTVWHWDRRNTASNCHTKTSDPMPIPGGDVCWKQIATVAAAASFGFSNKIAPAPTQFDNLTNTTTENWTVRCGAWAGGSPGPNIATYKPGGAASWSLNVAAQTSIPGAPVFLFNADGASVTTLTIAGATNAAAPLKLTLLTNATVTNSGTLKTCGSACNCPVGNPASCTDGAANVPVKGDRQCFAVRVAGACTLGTFTAIGETRCKRILDDPSNICPIGKLTAYDLTGAGACSLPGGPACNANAMCLNNGATVVGDLYVAGSVCMKNNAVTTGDLVVLGDVAIKNNFTQTGQIRASGNVEFKNNADIYFNTVTVNNMMQNVYFELLR